MPISVQGLKTIAGLGILIYWAGDQPGYSLELSKTDDNRIFIRYLPAGVNVGSTTPFLTIGTYPRVDAFAAAGRLAALSTSVRIGVGSGAVAYYRKDTPTSVFLAYRGVNAQIEVYDPSPGRARDAVTSGQITSVK